MTQTGGYTVTSGTQTAPVPCPTCGVCPTCGSSKTLTIAPSPPPYNIFYWPAPPGPAMAAPWAIGAVYC